MVMFGTQNYLLHAPQWLAAHVKALIPWNKGEGKDDSDNSTSEEENHVCRERKCAGTSDEQHTPGRCHTCKTRPEDPKRLDCGHAICQHCSVNYAKCAHLVNDLKCPICVTPHAAPHAHVQNDLSSSDKTPGGASVDRVGEAASKPAVDWEKSARNLILHTKAGTHCKIHQQPYIYYCKRDMCRRVVCEKCAEAKHVGHPLQPLSERHDEDRQRLESIATNLKRQTAQDRRQADQELKKIKESVENVGLCGLEQLAGTQDFQGVIDTRVNRIAEMVRTHAESLKEQVRETLETPMDFDALRRRMEQLKLLQDFVEQLVAHGSPEEIVRMGPDLKLAVERLTAVCAAQASHTLPAKVHYQPPKVDRDAIIAMITSSEPPTEDQIATLVGHLQISRSAESDEEEIQEEIIVEEEVSQEEDLGQCEEHIPPLPRDDAIVIEQQGTSSLPEEDSTKMPQEGGDDAGAWSSHSTGLLERGCLLHHFQTHMADDHSEPMPWDLCTGQGGEIAVTDGANLRLKVFSKDGKLIWATPPGSIPPAYGIIWWEHRQGFLVAVESSGLYLALPGGTAEKLSHQGPLGPIKRPIRLAVDDEKRIFILETTKARGKRVTVWSHDGNSILKIWRTIEGARYIATSKDLVLITVPHEKTLLAYNTWGNLQWEIFERSTSHSDDVNHFRLVCPTGVGAHGSGHIFLADCRKNSLLVVSSEDQGVRKLLTRRQGLWRPWSVDVTPGGELVVLESEARQVKVFQIWQQDSM